MENGFVVTVRGAAGQPREVRCVLHPGCPWKLSLTTAVSDDDAIIRAMTRAHLDERREPDRRAGGHVRKPRK